MSEMETGAGNRRAKGRLYKRDKLGREHPASSTIRGSYWLQYTVGGKRMRVALTDPDGQAITDIHAAKAARDRLLAPFSTANRVAQLEAVQASLSQARQAHEQAERQAAAPLRFADAWRVYLASQNRPDSGPDTLANYERHFRKLADWLTEHHPDITNVAEVTPALAQEFALQLQQNGASANTFNKYVAFLKLFYRIVIEEGRAERNPFERIKRRKVRANSRRPLSVEQIYRLLSTADGELAMLLGLGYFTGLRRGDCCTLRWSEVDLGRGLIIRVPNKVKGRSEHPEPVKIGIPPDLFRALAQTPPEGRNGYVLPGMAEMYLGGTRDRISRLVTAHFEANSITCDRPGTGGKTGVRAITDYGFHSLRYSYISHHAERGTPQAVIQANAGHRNPAMTEHYTRISDETARQVAAVLTLPSANPPALPAPAEPLAPAPLPAWASALLQSMTAANWQAIRDRLLAVPAES